jgi:hypothetical protein
MHHLPIGTLRWYLVNFRPKYQQAIMAATMVYLGMYGLCRMYLIYYILRIVGAQQGHSAQRAFARLRIPCNLGTGTMWLVNSTWLIMGISRLLTRDLGLTTGAQKRK